MIADIEVGPYINLHHSLFVKVKLSSCEREFINQRLIQRKPFYPQPVYQHLSSFHSINISCCFCCVNTGNGHTLQGNTIQYEKQNSLNLLRKLGIFYHFQSL